MCEEGPEVPGTFTVRVVSTEGARRAARYVRLGVCRGVSAQMAEYFVELGVRSPYQNVGEVLA